MKLDSRKRLGLPRRGIRTGSALAVLFLGFVSTETSAQSTQDEEVVELSPFSVDASEDSGYYASQTLSGGRTASRIQDLGTTIQAVTQEFLEDIGATNTTELLLYTTNTDTAGGSGNFTASPVDGGGVQNDSSARQEPDAAQRIRGLVAADRTRGFYRTEIPFDSYNASRLDIQRGANSFLFGLGSPAGIINYSPAQAQFRDSGLVGVRFHTEDFGGNFSQRYNIDLNKEIIEDTLAIRGAGVWENLEYIQAPAERTSNRLYGALTWRILKDQQTFLRASAETGTISTIPTSVFGPLENLSTFLDNPSGINFGGPANRFIGDPFHNIRDLNTVYQGLDADGNPLNFPPGNTATVSNRFWGLLWEGDSADGLPKRGMTMGIQPNMWLPGQSVLDPDNNYVGNRNVLFLGMPNLSELGGDFAGYNPQGLTNLDTFDFRKNLISGVVDTVDNDLRNYNVSFESVGFDNNLGIELGYNKEIWTRDSFVAVGAPVIMLDVNQSLPIGPNSLYGDTNPNFGRPFIASKASSRTELEVERETYRVTAFARYNFEEKHGDGLLKWLGRHRLTGLIDRDERNETRYGYRVYSHGNDAGFHLQQSDSTAFQRQNPNILYVGPAQPEAFTDPNFQLSDFVINGTGNAVFDFPEGFSVPIAYWDMGDPQNDAAPNNPRNDETVQVSTFTPRWGNESGELKATTVDSYAFNLQSFFLNDNFVANLGWRKDTWKEKFNNTAPQGEENERIFDPEYFNLDDTPINEESDDNFSYNLVARVPSQWMPDGYGFSVHYAESSNFVPNLIGSDLNGVKVPSSNGTSKDYGFTVSAMNNKFIVRVNWYESTIQNEFFQPIDRAYKQAANAHLARGFGNMEVELGNADADNDGVFDLVPDPDNPDVMIDPDVNKNGYLDEFEGDGNTYLSLGELHQIRDLYGEILTPWMRETGPYTFTPAAENDDGQASYFLGNGIWFAIADTADVKGEGLEIEAIVNPTPSWRIAFNVVQQKAVRTNLGPRTTEMYEAMMAAMDAVPNSKVAPQGATKLVTPLQDDPLFSTGVMWGNLILGSLTGQQWLKNTALEGADNPEIREWRVNAITNYSFREGRLKGLNVGGAYRYLDSAAAGYGLTSNDTGQIIFPDVTQPYSDEATHSFDFWVGYRFNLTERIEWRIQANIRNAFAGSGTMPTLFQPDGSVARVRYEPPRTFILQNTFTF